MLGAKNTISVDGLDDVPLQYSASHSCPTISATIVCRSCMRRYCEYKIFIVHLGCLLLGGLNREKTFFLFNLPEANLFPWKLCKLCNSDKPVTETVLSNRRFACLTIVNRDVDMQKLRLRFFERYDNLVPNRPRSMRDHLGCDDWLAAGCSEVHTV